MNFIRGLIPSYSRNPERDSVGQVNDVVVPSTTSSSLSAPSTSASAPVQDPAVDSALVSSGLSGRFAHHDLSSGLEHGERRRVSSGSTTSSTAPSSSSSSFPTPERVHDQSDTSRRWSTSPVRSTSTRSLSPSPSFAPATAPPLPSALSNPTLASTTTSSSSSSSSSASFSSSSSSSSSLDPLHLVVDSDVLLDAGMQKVAFALSLEQDSSRLEECVLGLEGGLKLLMRASKFATKEATKSRILSLLSTYLSRAERLKAQLYVKQGKEVPPELVEALKASTAQSLSASSASNHSVTGMSHGDVGVWVSRDGLEHKSGGRGRAASSSSTSSSSSSSPNTQQQQQQQQRRNDYGGLAPELISAVEGEMVDSSKIHVRFSDVVGLDQAKQALQEMVILPMRRPELFGGLRQAPKGLLLFGPPGNGKTMIAKATAKECGCSFFAISAASLTSKNYGEGEKLVRALFTVARARAPSVIFLDEADSMLGKRGSSSEHEASRRMKTEFLTQMDGMSSSSAASGSDPSARVTVLAATNLPEDLDDAVMRRLPKKIYIGPPDARARAKLIMTLLHSNPQGAKLGKSELDSLVARTEGYSNSDLTTLCQEASLEPLRRLGSRVLEQAGPVSIPPITIEDFNAPLRTIKPAVPVSRLKEYTKWLQQQLT